MKGCRIARAHLHASLDRELSLENRLWLDSHLALCERCAQEERCGQALQELLEGPLDPAPSAPDVAAASRSVFAALDRGEGRTWRPRLPVRRVALGLVGAMLALLLLTWSTRLEAPDRPEDGSSGPEQPGSAHAWTSASVELFVRTALTEAFGQNSSLDAALERFLARTREPARAGWSVRRFVEGLLEHPDPAIARLSARCLGALGDAGSAAALQRVLVRSDCPPELEDEAFAALGSLGEPAVGALEEALSVPRLAHGALRELCRVGGERAAQAIERCVRRTGARGDPSRQALLDALTATGPPAVAALLRLAAQEAAEGGERDAILARLPMVAGAGDELLRCMERERLPVTLTHRALVLLQPAGGLAWLERRCGEHRERQAALETLACYEGTGPLESLLRLDLSGRVPREDLEVLLGRLLDQDPARAEVFTEGLLARAEGPELHAWLALLIEGAHPATARPLARLAFSPRLGEDDRQWAALAVGELGTPEDAELLIGLVCNALEGERPDQGERRLAACFLSIHSLAGEEGVARALETCSSSAVQRVLASLQERDRSGPAVQVHRVARALEGVLAESGARRRRTKEIL